MKDIKKEFDEQFIQKGELSEPYLRQYEDRGSAPFYCSLCSMSEIEMSNNKTKDGRYFCDCSYWSEPHNAYVDKSGGKWLGWKDEKKALDLIEEITGIKASNELVNKIWDWFEPKLKKEREDAIKDIVKDIGNLKLKERKIDYSYINIPEEWEAEPENIEKRGYNQAVREINNKIYLFITNNLSQTKGGKDNNMIILEPYVDGDSWSYIRNQNGNSMRLTLEGYGSCTPVWKLVEFIDNLTDEQKQELSDRIDASQTKGGDCK